MALFEEGGRHLVGGTTRTSVFFPPYPFYVAEASGAQLSDLDGNVMIDFLNNYTSLLHGHAWPPIVEAVDRQMRKGSAYSAPSELEVQLARLIQSISDSTGSQARTAEQVMGNMQQILGVTEQASERTRQSAESVAQLATLSDELKVSVSGFKL